MPDSKRGMLLRFALGAVIVVVFTATTTAVAGLLEFKQAAQELSRNPAIKHARVTIPNPGEPQTILVVGSDQRDPHARSQETPHSDTIILVRLNPDSSTINVISVPRDLKVEIPHQDGSSETAKINQSYSEGGSNLVVKTLQQNVFPDLHVNHIVDLHFAGFKALVNAIGCVYTDVDRRYFNQNVGTEESNYANIDLQPGYQKLCGDDALDFVRYRHTDTDIVRSARQQDFIRWAKDQYGQSQLIENRDTLLRIFGKYTDTDPDLHTVDGLINLFNLVAFSAGHAVKQIPFPAILLPCEPAPAGGPVAPCYVDANRGAEQRAFALFMAPTHPQPAVPRQPGPAPPPPAGPSLNNDVADSRAQAAALGNVGMPVYLPRLIAAQSKYCTNDTCKIGPAPNSYPRGYVIHDQSDVAHPAYRLTLVMNADLGQYYGVQGTTWTSPPILNHPTETRTVGGRQLLLYFNGHKLTLVAWRAQGAVYWISNTLTDDLSNPQMLGIAASLTSA